MRCIAIFKTKKMNFLLLCFVFINVSMMFRDALSLDLKDMEIPDMVLLYKDDDSRTVKLDCPYDIEEDSRTLVVKWFKDNDVIYQWIRGQKPSVFPNYKGQVDEDYEISTEPNHQYRALVLINPTIESSGYYRCVVQTEDETESKEKKLNVVDTRNIDIIVNTMQLVNETHLECTVENVYPKPNLELISDEDVSVISQNVVENEDGLFNATSVFAISDYEGADDTDEYTCLVTFDNVQYNLTHTVTSACNGGLQSVFGVFVISFFILMFSIY